ncbi:MAG: CvpA family protein [Planctomycetota bacterium]
MFMSNSDTDPAPDANSDAQPEESAAEQAANQTGEAAQEAADQANQAVSGVLESLGVPPDLVQYVAPAISALLIIIVGYFVAKTLSRLIGKPVTNRVDETLGKFVSKIVFYVMMTCVLLAVLGMFGVNVTSFAAILGAAGFAVGLAFQGTLANFAAGVLLLVFRPFKVGDVINAAGITAKVTELDLFTTVMDTPDNRRIVVPNGAIAGGTIENISFHSERRVDVAVGVDYSASVDETRAALEAAAETLSDKLLTGDGRGYQIVLGGLGDSAVNWTVRFWCKAEDFWGVNEGLTHAVKDSLDEANIGIPYPTMDLNVVNQGS